jgi:hypothetical protein
MTVLRGRIPALLLLLLAAWLYWRVPLAVPPGLEMDELIEAEIAEQVMAGDWRPFYEAGQGREGLYYYWLAGWLAALGKGVFTLRLASTTVSLMGLAAVYALARYLFGRSMAFVCLAYAAGSFWLLFAARSGLRSTSLLLIAALAGYFFCRGVGLRSSRITFHASRFTLLAWGFLLGLSFYAYTAARVLPGVFLLMVVYLGVFHRPVLRERWRGVVMGAGVALLVALPFFWYLRANPAADQFEFLDFNRPLAALESGDPQPAVETTRATLGMFFVAGDPLMFDNVPGRPVFDRVNGGLFVVGVLVALWRWRRPGYAFVLIWLVVGLIPGMLSQPAPNFYRTVLAQVVVFVFPALAVVEGGRLMARWRTPGGELPPPPQPSPYQGEGVARPVFSLPSERKGWGERWRVVFVSVLAGGLLGLHLAGSWQGYFAEWPLVEGVRFFWQSNLAEVARYLDGNEEVESAAICTVLTYEHDPWWRPAWRSMPYLLQGDGAAVRFYDCRTTLVQPAELPAAYFFPDLPQPAEVMPAEFRGAWWDEARRLGGVFSRPEGVAVEVEEMALSLPALAMRAAWGPEVGGGTAELPVRFGESLALVGYRLDPERPQPGAPIRLLTAWEVLATPPPRLALFSHVLSDPQTVIAQQDGLALTSHSLRPGDRFWVVQDQVVLPAGEVPAGGYLVAIGLYGTDTLARLPVVDGEGVARGDRLFLR